MSIRLDWEIEAEKTIARTIGDDPEAKRRRRIRRLQILTAIGVLILFVGIITGAVFYRLDQINAQIEQNLRDTVAAEVAALRIGDWNAYTNLQRSATDDWLQEQRFQFESYQNLLENNDSIRLTGQILNITIEDPRARVQVQEIIDGTPYTRTWFYWRYEEDYDGDGEIDGWRHVPPDPTFWGDEARYEGEFVIIRYNGLDADLALDVGRHIDNWLLDTCDALLCSTVPPLRVNIAPDSGLQMGWLPEDRWVLQMPSPYMTRARTDKPFDTSLQLRMATFLADRMLAEVSGDITFATTDDARFLHNSVRTWLIGQFVAVDPQTHLLTSLIEHYSATAIGEMIQALSTDTGIDVLTHIGNAPLDQMPLDWRDFFTWRLLLERDLIQQQHTEAFLRLYDTRDEVVRGLASARFAEPVTQESLVVIHTESRSSDDGTPQRAAITRIGEGENAREVTIIFRLVNDTWVRAS